MRLTFATRSKCSLRSPWGFLCFVGLVTCLSGSVVTSRCKYGHPWWSGESFFAEGVRSHPGLTQALIDQIR